MPVSLQDVLSGKALVRGASVPEPFPVAVLTMEIQRGVVGDLSSFPELAQAVEGVGVIANVATLLDTARNVGIPIVHCLAEFTSDRAGTVVNTPLHSAVLRRPEHLLAATGAAELVPALGPKPGDLTSTRRHGVSPFTGTNLDATLRNLGVQVVVATGVSVNLGILGLCVEAVNLGYQVVVPTDAVAGVPADYAAAVLKNSVGLVATLSTVAEVVATLRGS